MYIKETLIKTIVLLIGMALSYGAVAGTDNTEQQHPMPISHFPETLREDCRDGKAKLYDECGDQVEILTRAITAAKAQNKRVLIIYGGEWCIWCHVLDKYLQGQVAHFDYHWREKSGGEVYHWPMQEAIHASEAADAMALNHYIAKHFVLAHIEGDMSNGAEALAMTGLNPKDAYYYPFVLVLDREGRYAGHLPPASSVDNMEVRSSGGQEYRGYDRKILLRELQAL